MSDTAKAIGSLALVGIVAVFAVAAGRTLYKMQEGLPEVAVNPRPVIAETLDKAGYQGVVLGDSTSLWCPDNYNLLGRKFSGTNKNGEWEFGVVCLDTVKPAKIVFPDSIFK